MSGQEQPSLLGIVPLIQVGNLVESLDYYREVLGFTLDSSWPDEGPPKWAMVSRSGAQFILTVDLGTSSGRFIAEKGNGVVFYVVTEEIEALYAELEAKEALVVQDLMEFGGRRQFTVADPNGYVLTFSEPFRPG